MRHKWKRLISYYRPYRGLFFRIWSLRFSEPAVIAGDSADRALYHDEGRYILPGEEALQIILRLGAAMVAMVAW